MQINRPPAIDTPPPSVATHTAAASSTTEAAVPPRASLKNRLTPRTEDYLLRLQMHGTPTQRLLAKSASFGLMNDLFMANPARDKPVSQFGVGMSLDGCIGILLANFMPHDDKFELEALAFRAERIFDSESISMEKVMLEHARELPEVEVDKHPSQSTVTPMPANSEQTPQGDIAAERKAIHKELQRVNGQTMHRKMASMLADRRVNDGRSSSRLTALPTAHAYLVKGKLRQMFGKSAALQPQRTTMSAKTSATSALIPLRGPQYQFSHQEFADFFEDHWLMDPKNTRQVEAVRKKKNASSSKEDKVVNPPNSGISPQLELRRGQFTGDYIKAELQKRLDQDLASSATNQAPTLPNRRAGRVVDNGLRQQLAEHLETGRAPSANVTPTPPSQNQSRK
ncbi:hypothetical protein ABH912_005496 [Pseudomonas sp. BT76 TE3572]